VQRALVDRRVDRHGLDPEPVGGLGDADGDLAAVGDEHPPEGAHGCSHAHCHSQSAPRSPELSFNSGPIGPELKDRTGPCQPHRSDIVADMASDHRDGTRFPGFESLALDTGEVIDALVRRRVHLGLSQTVVAARMGTSQSAVARLEAGRSDPRLSTLERYAAALDTSVAYAIAEAQPEATP
jgi:hypothetical protein